MKNIFKTDDLQQIPAFSPPHHTKTTDRKLIDETAGACHFALWHGEIEPGGMAEAHIHNEMEQVFVILEGEALLRIGDEQHRVGRDDIVFIPSKEVHQVTSVGDKTLKILIFMAPPPASLEAWQKQ
jgi:mannose-6-phosphate isomerase-like protein (cupin superfamily)